LQSNSIWLPDFADEFFCAALGPIVAGEVFLPHVHPNVVEAINGSRTYKNDESMVVLETSTVAAIIRATDAAAKGARIEVGVDHPLVWTEQMMPIMPVVRMRDADEAIDLAVEAEGGRRHTAVMHSMNIRNLSRMARLINCSIFVKNGPCFAGLGEGGEGHTSFTIASPTGEGMTDPRTFSRLRRCVVVDQLRIV